MPDDLAKAVLLRNTLEKEKRMLWPSKKNDGSTTKRKSVEKPLTSGARPPNPSAGKKSPVRDDAETEKSAENQNNQEKPQQKNATKAAQKSPKSEPSPTAREPSTFAAETEEEVLARSVVPASEHFPVAEEFVGPQHFHKLKLLGRGGIGKVYLVLLKNTDKLYAMKTLTKEEMIARNKVKRVMTEREILATANHPFIVTMYASFQTSERLCFVMEFCEGGEFFRVLQKQPKKRLKEDAGRFYAAEVTLALEYLHHIGFIYRDLKPENILMRANGHVALTDFDLSKQAHAVSPKIIQQQQKMIDRLKGSFAIKRSGSKINELKIVDSEPVLPYQTNSFVGTEEYIAPEVVNGTGQTSAVDWWTLGILIYEMLTGTTPFKGSYADETFSNIMNNEIKWPADVDVGPDAKNLVKKLLRREADKRLGHENGASDIKTHKWFSKINFTLIRNLDAPIMPKIRDPTDLSQYGPLKDDSEEADAIVNDKDNTEDPFQNFSLRRDSETLNRQY